MKIRYNQFTKFYYEDNHIIIKTIGTKQYLKLGYDKTIYDFMLFLENNVFITENDIQKYGVKESIIKLFFISNILEIYQYNSGIESIYFNNFIKNPNHLLENINNQQLDNLYIDVENGIYKILNLNELKEQHFEYKEKDININNETLNSLGTVRLQKNCK